MRIGYIYLFGQDWEEWKKHNKPLCEIIDELNELNCDKIYMDVFIPYQEVESTQQIGRIDMKTLLEWISGSSSGDEFELYVRGRVENQMCPDELQSQVEKEIKRINDRWENSYENRLRKNLDS